MDWRLSVVSTEALIENLSRQTENFMDELRSHTICDEHPFCLPHGTRISAVAHDAPVGFATRLQFQVFDRQATCLRVPLQLGSDARHPIAEEELATFGTHQTRRIHDDNNKNQKEHGKNP